MTTVSRMVCAFAFFVVIHPVAAQSAQGHGPGTVPDGGIEIPFELGPRGHIVVDLAVDGHEPVPFVLDTGAGRTVLNQARLSVLGLGDRPSGEFVQGAHGRLAMGLTEVGSLSIGEVALGGMEMATMDLSGIEAGDMTLFGVLGFDLLSRFDLTLDFVDETVAFHPRAEEWDGCAVCAGEVAVPFRLARGTHIELEVSISGQPITAILDTGSGRTGMNGLAARAIGVELPASVPGDHAPALQVGELRLGDGALARDLVVGVVELPVFEALGIGDRPALLMGTGALADHRIGISYGLGLLSVR